MSPKISNRTHIDFLRVAFNFKTCAATALILFSLAQATKAQDSSSPPSSNASPIPFSEFNVKVDVEEGEFEVRGAFKLGPGSDGINLFKEEVVVRVGDSFAVTLPPGSFKQEERGKVSFKGVVEGIDLDVSIRVLGQGGFQIKIEGEGGKRSWKLKPEDIRVTIGDDGGGGASQLAADAKEKG